MKKNIILFISLLLFCLADLSAIDIENGLIGYFPFNGNANDESEYDNHGTVKGANLTEDYCGNPNSAYHFDGIDDLIDVGYDEIYNFSGSITLAAWVIAEPGIMNGAKIISKWKSHSDFAGSWALTRKHFNISSNGTNSEFTTYNSDHFNEWIFVTGVYDISKNTLKYYVNCELVDQVIGPNSINQNTSHVYIGAASYFNQLYFKGTIDEVRIYDRPLNQEEICYIYHMYDVDIDISGQNYICVNNSATLTIEDIYPNNYYEWSTGETSQSITVTEPGTYYATSENIYGCVAVDSITVNLRYAEDFSILQNGDFCFDEEVELYLDNEYDKYEWSTGDTTETVTVSEPGTYSVKVTDEYGCELEKEITLEIPSSIDVIFDDEGFSDICTYEEIINLLTYRNRNESTEAVISSVYLKQGKSFSIDTNNYPLAVAPNSDYTENIVFSPTSEGNFYDTLVVVVSKPCPDRFEFPLHGRGLPVNAKVWIGDTLAHPQYDFCVPVYGLLECDFKEGAYVDYNFEFSVDFRVFRDIYVKNGRIIKDWREDFNTHFIISDTSVFMNSEPRIINWICGTLLGSSVSESEITIDSTDWYGAEIPTVTEGGNIKIDLCELDFRVLSLRLISNIQLRPNPAGNSVTCYISYPSPSKAKLQVISITGDILKEVEFEGMKGEKLLEYEMDLSGIPNGIYIVKYTCREKILEDKLIIAK